MQLSIKLFVAFLAIIGAINAVPVHEQYNNQESNYGPQQQKCSTNPEQVNFEQGKSYQYNYVAKSKFELENGQQTEIQVSGVAEITGMHQCQNQLQIRDVQIQGAQNAQQLKKDLESNQFMFHYENGRVGQIELEESESNWSSNIKRAVISALQVHPEMQPKNSGKQHLIESDVNGICSTEYQVASRQSDKIVLKKSKQVNECSQRHRASSALNPLPVATDGKTKTMPVMQSSHQCQLTIEKQHVREVSCEESGEIRPLSMSSGAAGSKIRSTIQLQLKRTQPASQKRSASVRGKHLKRSSLLYTAPSQQEQQQQQQQQNENAVQELLQLLANGNAEHTGPEYLVDVEVKLVEKVAKLNYETIKRLTEAIHKHPSLGKNQQLQDIYYDAVAQAGSAGAVRHTLEQIQSPEYSQIRKNYWLSMFAFAKKPNKEAVRAVANFLKEQPEEKIPRQAWLGATALIRNYLVQRVKEQQQQQQQQGFFEQEIRHEQVIAKYPEVKDATDAIVARIQQQLRRLEKESHAEKQKQLKTQVIVALKSLANIGVTEENAQKMLTIAENGAHSIEVRVYAIETLAKLSSRTLVHEQLMKLFKSQSERSQVRIAAFKYLVHHAEEQQVQEIVQHLHAETNKQVGSFAISLLESILKSNEPQKQYLRNVIRRHKLPKQRFQLDVTKYSRKFELSRYFEEQNFGGKFTVETGFNEADKQLESVTAEFNLDIFDNQLQLAEFGIRQRGFNKLTEQLMREIQRHSLKELAQEIYEMFGLYRNKQEQEKKQNKNKNSAIGQLIRTALSSAQKDAEASVYLKIDGKTVAYVELAELVEITQAKSVEIYETEWRQQLQANINRAFSVVFMDQEHYLPQASGIPLQLQLNAATMLGFKWTQDSLWPQFASVVRTRIGFAAPGEQGHAGLQWTGRMQSAPGFEMQVKRDQQRRAIGVHIHMQQKKKILFAFESNLDFVQANGSMQALRIAQQQQQRQQYSQCTGSLSKLIGVQICAEMHAPKNLFSTSTPLIPFNGPAKLQLTIDKTDNDLSGWEINFATPAASKTQWSTNARVRRAVDLQADEMQEYHFSLKPKGIKDSRHVGIKVAYNRHFTDRMNVHMEVATPWKSVEADLQYQLTNARKQVKLALSYDKQQAYNVEVSLEQQSESGKIRMVPVIKVQGPKLNVQYTGSVQIGSNQRRQSLELQITDASKANNAIRVYFVRDGQLSLFTPFKLSAEMKVNYNAYQLHAMAESEMAPGKKLSNNLLLEYQLSAQSPKQRMQMQAGVQDISSGGVRKYNGYLEVSSSTMPQYDVHLQWSHHSQAGQQMQNEFTVMWKDQMSNANNRIHILHTAKSNQATPKLANYPQLERMLRAYLLWNQLIRVEVAPYGFNYQLQSNANVQMTGSAPRVRFDIAGRNMNTQVEYKGSFDAQLVSRNPLMYKIEAHLQTPEVEMAFSNRGEEMSPNNYHGKAMLQWKRDRSASLTYNYKIGTQQQQAAGDKLNHQLSTEFKIEHLKQAYKHSIAVRVNDKECEVKSQLSAADKQLWDSRVQVNTQTGNVNAYLTTGHFKTKLIVDLSGERKELTAALEGSNLPYQHKTTVTYNGRQITMDSKTTHMQKQVMNVALRFQQGQAAQARVQIGEYIDLSYEANHQTAYQVSGAFAVAVKLRQRALVHKTKFAVNLAKTTNIVLTSKTSLESQDLLTVEVNFNSEGKNEIKVESKRWTLAGAGVYSRVEKSAKVSVFDRRTQLEHFTEIQVNQRNAKVSTVTKRHQKMVAAFQLDVSLEKYEASMKFESDHFKAGAGARVGAETWIKCDAEDKKHAFRHETELQLKKNYLQLKSYSTSNGEKQFDIGAKFELDNSSQVQVITSQHKLSIKYTSRNGSGSIEYQRADNELKHNSQFKVTASALEIESSTYYEKQQTKVYVKLCTDEPSKLNVNYQSQVTFACEIDLKSATKTMKLAYSDKQRQVQHQTLAKYQQLVALEFATDTQIENSKYHKMVVKMSRNEPTRFELETRRHLIHTTLDLVNQSKKSIQVEYQRPEAQQHHRLEATYQIKKFAQIKYEQIKDQRRYRLAEVMLARKESSYVRYENQQQKVNVEVAQFAEAKSVKVTVQCARHEIDHKTRIQYDQQELTIESVTSELKNEKITEPIVAISILLSPRKESTVRYESADHQIRAAVAYAAVKSAKLQIKGKRAKFEHETELKYENARSASLHTSTQIATHKPYALEAKIDRNQVQFGYQSSRRAVKIAVNPFEQDKYAKISMRMDRRSTKMSHETQINWTQAEKKLTITSETKRNDQQLLQLTGEFHGVAARASMKFENQYYQAELVTEVPRTQVSKVVRFECKSKKGSPLSHVTRIAVYQNDQYELFSDTRSANDRLVQVDARIESRTMVKIAAQVNTQPIQVKFDLDTMNPQEKRLNTQIRVPMYALSHEHEFKWSVQQRRATTKVVNSYADAKFTGQLAADCSDYANIKLTANVEMKMAGQVSTGQLQGQWTASGDNKVTLTMVDATGKRVEVVVAYNRKQNAVTVTVSSQWRRVPSYNVQVQWKKQQQSGERSVTITVDGDYGKLAELQMQWSAMQNAKVARMSAKWTPKSGSKSQIEFELRATATEYMNRVSVQVEQKSYSYTVAYRAAARQQKELELEVTSNQRSVQLRGQYKQDRHEQRVQIELAPDAKKRPNARYQVNAQWSVESSEKQARFAYQVAMSHTQMAAPVKIAVTCKFDYENGAKRPYESKMQLYYKSQEKPFTMEFAYEKQSAQQSKVTLRLYNERNLDIVLSAYESNYNNNKYTNGVELQWRSRSLQKYLKSEFVMEVDQYKVTYNGQRDQDKLQISTQLINGKKHQAVEIDIGGNAAYPRTVTVSYDDAQGAIQFIIRDKSTKQQIQRYSIQKEREANTWFAAAIYSYNEQKQKRIGHFELAPVANKLKAHLQMDASSYSNYSQYSSQLKQMSQFHSKLMQELLEQFEEQCQVISRAVDMGEMKQLVQRFAQEHKQIAQELRAIYTRYETVKSLVDTAAKYMNKALNAAEQLEKKIEKYLNKLSKQVNVRNVLSKMIDFVDSVEKTYEKLYQNAHNEVRSFAKEFDSAIEAIDNNYLARFESTVSKYIAKMNKQQLRLLEWLIQQYDNETYQTIVDKLKQMTKEAQLSENSWQKLSKWMRSLMLSNLKSNQWLTGEQAAFQLKTRPGDIAVELRSPLFLAALAA